VRVREHLSDVFPIRNGVKQGNALPPLLFSYAVEYSIRRVQIHIRFWFMLKILNVLGGSVHTIKNTQAVVVGSKEIGLEVNSDETKYIVMSRDQNAGQSHNIKIDNNSFERLEEFEC